MEVYHIVYKTINLLNNKFYIGVHKSKSLQDSYLGSGRWISRSIKKYGRDNFRRENLFIYLSSVEAFSKENELVSIHLKDPLCMNLKQGGMGGFDYINENELNNSKDNYIKASKNNKLKYHSDIEYRILIKSSLNAGRLISKEKRIKICLGNSKMWIGKHHTKETKLKMSKPKNIGSDNPSYGTCWITKDNENKKVKKEDLPIWLDQGWSKGRKIVKNFL